MISIFIKSFFIFTLTLYSYSKTINNQRITPIKTIFLIGLLPTILSVCLDSQVAELKYLLSIILLWILVSLYSHKPQISFILLCICFAINYCIHALSSFIISLLIFIICGISHSFSYVLLAIFAGCLHYLFVSFLFSISRFKKGMNFLFKNNAINYATILSLIFINIPYHIHSHESYDLGLLLTTIFLAFLIYWWQAQITKSYRRSLELRELESLRTELQEKNSAMMKVMEENERVHFINHRDNGLLSTLDYTAMSILEMDFSDEAAIKARCRELANEIHRARDRRITTIHTNTIKIQKYETDITLLNLLLNRTSKRAIDEHVLFTAHINTELADFVPSAISDDDFVYLLSDLLDNAFVATRDIRSRMIQIQFYKWNKQLVVEIADNGIPFEVDSILEMGINRRTTHEDTGGTGVGLMTIWSMKEKYGATYHLDEYETATPFTKKISLTFDKKNRYSVRTWRKEEILKQSKRIDLQVYGQDEA